MSGVARIVLAAALVLALAGLALGSSQPAAAQSGVSECGAVPSRHSFNVTTRNVSCARARRLVRSSTGQEGSSVFRKGAFACRYRDLAHELADIRCTASRGRVGRWKTGV